MLGLADPAFSQLAPENFNSECKVSESNDEDGSSHSKGKPGSPEYYRSVVQECTHALELKPDDAEVLRRRASAYHATGDLKQAIADYDSAISVAPNFVRAYMERGTALGMSGSLNQAIENYKKAAVLLEAAGDDSAADVLEMANRLSQAFEQNSP